MINPLASALLPVLRLLDPERAHRMALAALGAGLIGQDTTPDDAALAVQALGLRFANPIGLAAGFDKDAVAVLPLMRLGFGFVEVGTVTPRPQPGNPRPRLFRLKEDRAVINRMGFNNGGIAAYAARLDACRIRPAPLPAPLGANLGINKDGADPERDYPALVAAVADRADYITINVSSPNTPGLRDLQGEAKLAAILAAIKAAVPQRPPLLVKIAPDLADEALGPLVEACIAGGVQGLIVSNTTITRPPGLRSRNAAQAGGLSGAPLFARSTAMLARVSQLAAGRLLLVGVGGIRTGRDALTKIRAGATLVQVYSEFAYAGPTLIPRLKAELVAALRQDGFSSISQAVGVDVA